MGTCYVCADHENDRHRPKNQLCTVPAPGRACNGTILLDFEIDYSGDEYRYMCSEDQCINEAIDYTGDVSNGTYRACCFKPGSLAQWVNVRLE